MDQQGFPELAARWGFHWRAPKHNAADRRTSMKAMTTQEVANECGVHVQTVREWIRTQQLGAEKFGHRTLRIYPSELKRFRENRRIQPIV